MLYLYPINNINAKICLLSEKRQAPIVVDSQTCLADISRNLQGNTFKGTNRIYDGVDVLFGEYP